MTKMRRLEGQAHADRSQAIAALVEDLVRFHQEMVVKHGYLPDSVPLLREIRERG